MMKATLAVLALSAMAAPALAQTGVYYMTAGDQKVVRMMQGGASLGTFSTAIGGNDNAYGIAVSDAVRTVGTVSGWIGGKFGLTGGYLGETYTNPGFNYIFDGTGDGTSNYLVQTGSNQVYRTLGDWSSPTLQFTTGRTYSFISYQPSNDSIWLANNAGNVDNYDMSGSYLGGFNNGQLNCGLGFDPADSTLWMYAQGSGVLRQYNTSGGFLQSVSYSTAENYIGGEFTVPAPGSLALLSLGGLAAARRRRM